MSSSVSLALCGSLFAWAWVAFLLAPVLVTRRSWAVRHPAAALTVWAGLFATGVLGVGLALALTVRSAAEASRGATAGDPLSTCDTCHAAAVFGASWLLTVAVLVGLTLTGCRAIGLLVRRRRTGRAARTSCRGLPCGTVDGVPVAVLASERYLAVCTPGRRPHVVVSTALRDLLSPAELAAVVAHESAHLGRWHRSLLAVALLHQACLRGWPAAEETRRGIALLVELAADDRAAARCGPRTTAAALHKVAEASGDEAMRLRARRTSLSVA